MDTVSTQIENSFFSKAQMWSFFAKVVKCGQHVINMGVVAGGGGGGGGGTNKSVCRVINLSGVDR